MKGGARRGRWSVVFGALVVLLVAAGLPVWIHHARTTVTLVVDGRQRSVTLTHLSDPVSSPSVLDVLDAGGVDVGVHDQVVPAPASTVSDGDKVTVKVARPVTIALDGQPAGRFWVTATTVRGALSEIASTTAGERIVGAEVVPAGSTPIHRDGITVAVTSRKRLTLIDGRRPGRRLIVPAATVGDVVRRAGVRLGARDLVTPALTTRVGDGATIRVIRIRVEVLRHVTRPIAYGTLEVRDPSMPSGVRDTVKAGRAGRRELTYRRVFRNGRLAGSRVLSTHVVRPPVDRVVNVGTSVSHDTAAKAPAQSSGSAPVSGTGVWDALARCESGGNWSIDTGNGYYGGLQFNAATWHAYGGTGLPHQHSRTDQIRIAERVRAARGGYSAWPACAAKLGLPR